MDTQTKVAPMQIGAAENPIDAGVRIGHVHLKVADLERALAFYCGVLGFELTQRRPGAAFISAACRGKARRYSSGVTLCPACLRMWNSS